MPESRLCRAIVVALLALTWAAAPARAHSGAAQGGPDRGVSIANLTHGQMRVIADYRRAILALAARLPAPDADYLRVLNHARIQRAFCGAGIMPAAITDEASPFNACSHAYLAATRDVLMRLRAVPRPDARVLDLAARIQHDMLMQGSALELCQYSADHFNTANTLRPNWRDALRHWPSLAAMAAAALTLAAMAWIAARALRLPTRT